MAQHDEGRIKDVLKFSLNSSSRTNGAVCGLSDGRTMLFFVWNPCVVDGTTPGRRYLILGDNLAVMAFSRCRACDFRLVVQLRRAY